MNIKKMVLIVVLSFPMLLLAKSAGFAQRARPCRAYTVDLNQSRNVREGYSYREVNNCPLTKGRFSIQGTFANKIRQASISIWEPAYYVYEGKNYVNGSSVKLYDFDIAGTTSRPQYRFKDKKLTYVITFQYADASTIRLEVFRGKQRIINDLLDRKSR